MTEAKLTLREFFDRLGKVDPPPPQAPPGPGPDPWPASVDTRAANSLAEEFAGMAPRLKQQGRALAIATNVYLLLKLAEYDGLCSGDLACDPIPEDLVEGDLLAALAILAGKQDLNGRIRTLAASGGLGAFSNLARSGSLDDVLRALPLRKSPTRARSLDRRITRVVKRIVQRAEGLLAVANGETRDRIQQESAGVSGLDIPRWEWGRFLEARLFGGSRAETENEHKSTRDRRYQAVRRWRQSWSDLTKASTRGIEGNNG